MSGLCKYFEQQGDWNAKCAPWPHIDHALRIDRRPDGSFHFYIHPANAGGVTTDFIAYPDGRVEEGYNGGAATETDGN